MFERGSYDLLPNYYDLCYTPPTVRTLPYIVGDILSDIPAAVLVSRLAMAIAIIEGGIS